MIKISDCKRIGKACLYCGKIVRTNRKDFKFCSQDCYRNNKIKNRTNKELNWRKLKWQRFIKAHQN